MGLAAWGNNKRGHDISVVASGCGNVTLVQNLLTRQGSLTEIVLIDGNFEPIGRGRCRRPGFSSYIDIAPCGAFAEHKTLRDIQGYVYLHEEVVVSQPYYAMGAYVDIEAFTPEHCEKGDGLTIRKCVGVSQFETCGGPCMGPARQVLGLMLAVDGCVEEGTFTVGHSGTASWQGCVPWQVKQGVKLCRRFEIPGLWYNLRTKNDSNTVRVRQSATIDAGVFYEFAVSSTVFFDVVHLRAGIFDFAWIPSSSGP
jgi:hypothetical protein